MIINREVISEFKNLESLSLSMPESEVPIFQKISELDQKFSNEEYYNLNIEGVIGNISYQRGSEKLIKYAICRLKVKTKNSSDDFVLDKFNYDLGTLLQGKADLLNYSSSDKFLNLVETKDYSEARNYYNKVNEENFALAHTNQANILDNYKRNFEAILLYDKVLKRNPEFGMALGNKAIALYRYYKLSPNKSNLILKIAEDLLKSSLEDPELLEIGGQKAFDEFNRMLNSISLFLKEINFTETSYATISINEYEKFIAENNLFLNFDFGFITDKDSIEDSLFPSFIQKLDEMKTKEGNTKIFSDKVVHSIKIFNQIKEDFTSARFLFYEWSNKDISLQDKSVSWVYTFDYSRNSIKFSVLKMILANLYNILEKIARVVLTYFEINNASDDIYLNHLELEKYKNLLLKTKNYQLLALYDLSKDFHKNKVYNKFQKLRNKLTHSAIDIFELPEKEGDFTFETLYSNIVELFLIVKSAILYASLGIDEEVKMEGKKNKTIPIYITTQKAVFKNSILSDDRGII